MGKFENHIIYNLNVIPLLKSFNFNNDLGLNILLVVNVMLICESIIL